MESIYLGIDFGAENIMVTFRTQQENLNRIVMFGNRTFLKNFFAYNKSTKEKYFGHYASEKFLDDESNSIVLFSRYKQDLVKSREELPAFYAQNNFTPKMILEEMLLYLKKSIDQFLYETLGSKNLKVVNTVITVPVKWLEHDNRLRQIYQNAMKKAGFSSVSIIEEPIAAAANVIHSSRAKSSFQPKENDNFMIIDIGASTVDISLCHYKEKIEADTGSGSEYAGNYLDTLIGSLTTKIDINDILNNTSKYHMLLTKAQEIKENSRIKRSIKFKQALIYHPDKKKNFEVSIEHMQEATKRFTDELIKTIDESLKKFKFIKIDYLLICGGMSNYKSCDFQENFFKKLKETYPTVFSTTYFIDEDSVFSENFRSFTISYGAALLAQDSSLVKITLPYNIGIEVTYKQANKPKENRIYTLIKQGFDYKSEQNRFFSLKEAVNVEFSGAELEIQPKDIIKQPLIIIYEQQGSTSYVQEPAYWERTENLKNTRYKNVDVLLSIDSNGILHADLYEILDGDKKKIAVTSLNIEGKNSGFTNKPIIEI